MSTMYAIHVMLNNAFTVWKYNLLQKKLFCVFVQPIFNYKLIMNTFMNNQSVSMSNKLENLVYIKHEINKTINAATHYTHFRNNYMKAIWLLLA